jgi:hypothetical protein
MPLLGTNRYTYQIIIDYVNSMPAVVLIKPEHHVFEVFFDFSGSIYAYTHVSKINYTPQLSIWSPPVSLSLSLCPPDIHGGAETSCGNCFVCSACVNMISENPGFLERRLTRISILGREVRRRHGTRRATRPAPLARGPWRRVRSTLLTRPDRAEERV